MLAVASSMASAMRHGERFRKKMKRKTPNADQQRDAFDPF
jgi:hypothetical protein